jgi:Rrf2 family protein
VRESPGLLHRSSDGTKPPQVSTCSLDQANRPARDTRRTPQKQRRNTARGVLDKNDVPMHIEHVKLSNKGRYAVRALFDIAFYNEGRPTQVKDIAERQHIPPRFLEQIFQDLKRSGIVGSKRGPQGGYSLSRRPVDIRLGDVVRALEGPISLGDREPGPRRTQPSSDARRVTEIVFKDLSTRVEACFDEITIADICTRAEDQGLKRPGAQRYVYVI